MDGQSAVAELRRRPPADETPVVIVSAYDRLEFRTEAVAAGCAGFITKPVDPAELLKKIRLLLERVEGDSAAPV
jgi:DNA-binding response OmpR family regulator